MGSTKVPLDFIGLIFISSQRIWQFLYFCVYGYYLFVYRISKKYFDLFQKNFHVWIHWFPVKEIWKYANMTWKYDFSVSISILSWCLVCYHSGVTREVLKCVSLISCFLLQAPILGILSLKHIGSASCRAEYWKPPFCHELGVDVIAIKHHPQSFQAHISCRFSVPDTSPHSFSPRWSFSPAVRRIWWVIPTNFRK